MEDDEIINIWEEIYLESQGLMAKDKAPPAAFAVSGFNLSQEGLSKREYYAAVALGAVLSNNSYTPKAAAQLATEYADALINSLEPKED